MGRPYAAREARDHRVHNKEGGGTLRVTDIRQLIYSSAVKDVVDHGGQIVDSNVVPLEVPEGLQQWGFGGVLLGVGISPGITHPHIVSLFRQQVSQSTVGTTEDPIR